MAQYQTSNYLNSVNSYEIIMKSTQAVLMKIYRKGFDSLSADYATYMILAGAMIQSESRRIAEAMIWGAPKMADVDSQGQFTSHGQISQESVGLVLQKMGAVLDIQDIDMINYQNVGRLMQIMAVIGSQAIEGVVRQASHLVNNLSSGVYTTYNGETPAMLERDPDSLFMLDGNNLAPNMGSAEWSIENYLAAKVALANHKTLDDTSIPNSVIGLIVHRNMYDKVKNDLKNTHFNSTVQNYQDFYGQEIPLVGRADFRDEKTWLLITTASQIGWAVYRGFILPTIFMAKDDVNENVKVVTKWYNQPFCLSPYGFYLNEFEPEDEGE